MCCFVYLLVCFVLPGALACSVKNCESFMFELANRFSCDGLSGDACEFKVLQQLLLIVPKDAEAENIRLRKETFTFLPSPCLVLRVCGGNALFKAWNDWSRVPGAISVINASLVELEERQKILDLICGEEYLARCTVSETGDCAPNITCIAELNLVELELAQVWLRLMYSRRRERKFLTLLQAACDVQGSSLCSGVMMHLSDVWDDDVQMLTPSIASSTMNLMLESTLSLTEELENRSCTDAELPCLRRLVQPALASLGTASDIYEIIQSSLRLLDPNDDSSRAVFIEFVKRSSIPFVRCSFELQGRNGRSTTDQLCSLERKQLVIVNNEAKNLRIWNYATAEQVEQLHVSRFCVEFCLSFPCFCLRDCSKVAGLIAIYCGELLRYEAIFCSLLFLRLFRCPGRLFLTEGWLNTVLQDTSEYCVIQWHACKLLIML
jgi:hypothetical protein